jgi:hypothetical protein
VQANGSTIGSQRDSRPPARRVSRARWGRALQVVARTRSQPPGWTPMTVAVAGRLASYMSATGGRCFPGIVTLAGELLSKPQTVAKHIRLLEAGGFLEVHRGGGRGRRTEYYALLPIDVHDLVVHAPARPAPRRRAAAPRPSVDQVDVDVDEGRPALAAAAAAPAGGQLAGEAQAHGDGDGLVVNQAPAAPPAPAAAASGDGAETVSLGRRGGERVSHTPSRLPGHRGGHEARSGGPRPKPRTTRPARVPAPVAAVIAAIPLTERQRLWVRTWAPALEAIATALEQSGVPPAVLARAIDQAREWPLREARYPGSALVARLPAALELLALQRRAEARRRELAAAPQAAAEASAPAAPAAARAALAAARAAVAAARCPLHPAGCLASPLVSAPGARVSRPGTVRPPAAPGGPGWRQAWAVLLGDRAVTVDPDGYLRPA